MTSPALPKSCRQQVQTVASKNFAKHYCAKRLSSTPEYLTQEGKNLKGIFLKLKYPEKLIEKLI